MCTELTLDECPSGYRDCEPCDIGELPGKRATGRLDGLRSAHSTATALSTDRERLLPDHIESIYRLIYASVGNREEAEDLTSRVFMTASQHIGRRTPEETYGALVRGAHVVLDDHWRAFSCAPAAVSDRPLMQSQATTQAAVTPTLTPAQRVDRILVLLPARERQVLTYRFLLNRSVRETAEMLLLTEAEVKALVYHALKMAANLDPGE